MSRTTAPLRATGAAAAASALLALWAAGPAQAHGAPTNPVSRTFACSPDGGANARTAACRAAIAANGAPFTFFDNLRVSGVNGRDRRLIPDGKLCSGGLADYKGLDLARPDWPSTQLAPGARLTMTYASTIPHSGTFKLYLTKPGYDPAKPLTWSDLPTRPFVEVKDPPLTDGAYHIAGTLPSDRTGRQVLYTIWQNSSTPDTYYSCSDVVFASGASSAGREAGGQGSAGSASAGASPAGTSPAGTDSSATAAAGGSAQASASPAEATGPQAAGSATPQAASTPVASATDAGSGPSAPLVAGGAAAVLMLTGGAALFLRLRRR